MENKAVTDDFLNYAKKAQKRSGNMNDYLIWQPSIFLSIIETIENIGPRDCPVIIKGETGTAKEAVARQIHQHSSRNQNTFVPVNCSAIGGRIFETQLFGQMAETSKGMKSKTLGAFRAADGGTIFLDDIDKLSPEHQAGILRLLEESHVTPIGSVRSFTVNVRIICSTSCDLREMAQEGKFLSDLYFRLNVANIELPPLRKRPEDIAILAKYFLDVHAQLYDEPAKTLSSSSVKVLTNYNWPGNVRELSNVMERAFVMSRSKEIGLSELPKEILTADILPHHSSKFPPMDEVDKKLIIRALQTSKGQKMAAAKLLQIDHRKLNRLMKKFDLQSSNYKTQTDR